jgi:signal transduction histidine kinase
MDEAEMKKVDIHEGIDSTLMILQNRLKSNLNRPAIAIVKDYGELPLIECYAGQLNQVFMNLLTNAIDAFDEIMEQQNLACSTPQITIRTQKLDGNRVAVHVTDNGPGIPEAIQARLFDPFFTTKPIGKGTGLGLSISYQIITEKHGGVLKCVSGPGEGAKFIIEIPLRSRQR